MTLHIVTAGPGGGDWEVEGDLARITLAELASAIGVGHPSGCVTVDGRTVDGRTTVADAAVARGARLDRPGPARLGAAPPDDADERLRIDQIAGLAAGSSAVVGPGRLAIGPALAAGPTELSPGVVAQATSVVDTADRGARLVSGRGAVFRVHTVERHQHRLTPDERGVVAFHRAPRTGADDPPGPPVAPIAPPEPGAPAPFSWATLLAPLPVAIVMAFVVSPRFAFAAIASPVIAVGRWAEARLRHRRRSRARAALVTTQRAEHAAACRRAAATEALRRWHAHPDPAALARAAACAMSPTWSRRAADADALALTVAAGAARWSLGRPSPGASPDEAAIVTVPDAPVVIALRDRHAVGVIGSASAAGAVARWLVAQAVLLHGPSDLVVAAATAGPTETAVGAGGEPPWSWLKWLPHLVDDAGTRRVATTLDDTGALVAALTDELEPASPRQPCARFGLVVVDDPTLARSRALREAMVRAGSPLRAVVVAPGVEQLPAWCDVVAEVDDDGAVVVRGIADPPVGPALAIGVTPAWASDAARHLGRLDDPELTGRSVVPVEVTLADVLGVAPLLDAPDELAAHLERRWRTLGGLAAPLGRAAAGEFALDLLADGPHALVAGTTGAGKSELLRSWIAALAATASPDELNLVLVDFKGGGAFDACADLPHTVAVVTDLDAHLGARALRCLRAEVRYREARLRAASCSDLAQFAASAPDEPLPRLVVVIDEFATLVAELPEFVTSIVDVAQRGRSLGIHLVLATQRPQGVVDNKVRANTNLRVALRVQDDADALDVVGTAEAARLSRRTPGRALARLGSGDITLFQTALVSCRTGAPGSAARLAARRFSLLDEPTTPAAAAADAGPTDLDRLVVGARLAARHAGCRPPRVPWPAPLPGVLDAVDLWAAAVHEPWSVVLGLADEPDAQRQVPWRWAAGGGNLLVYGARLDDAAQVLTAVGLGLASTHPVDAVHLYAVDAGSGGGLRALGDLPHCGALVDAADTARVARLVDVLSDVVERRRQLVRDRRLTAIGPGDGVPLVALLLDNVGAVLEALDNDGERDAAARLVALARDGASLGVVTVITANHERALPGRLAALVPQRVTLRMADPTSYLAVGLVPREMPALDGLRGVAVDSRTEIQFARVDDPTAMAHGVAERTPAGAALPAPVRTLGPTVRAGDLGGAPGIDATAGSIVTGAWSLTIASTPSLRPVRLELPPGIHALVSGPPASGRSSALAAVAQAALAASGGGELQLVLVVPRRSPLVDALGGRGVVVDDPDALEVALGRAPVAPRLVLVDDAEHVAAPLGQALARLAERADDRLRLVVAGRADQLRAPGSWTSALRHGRTGIALQPAPGDGDVFRTTFPLRSALPAGPGRGLIVAIGSVVPAQVLYGR